MVRVEYGLVFFGYDMDRSNNPFEVWSERMVTLDGPDFIGKEALRAIRAQGIAQKVIGLEIDGLAAAYESELAAPQHELRKKPGEILLA